MSAVTLAAADARARSVIALATRGLSKSFGSLIVARDIELNLPAGARYALIGPNGAGKTTLISLVTGMLTPDGGQILLNGEDITNLEPQTRVRRGLARTFQINALFAGLTPLEAVTLAVAERRGLTGNFWRNIASHREAIDEAYDILVKLKLGDCCYQPTRELPYGRQRLLEIALALATKPRVLLLDEPAAGVPPEESGDIFEVVAGLSDDSRCCSSNTICMSYSVLPRASSSLSAAPSSPRGHRQKLRRIKACARSISGRAIMAEPLLKLKRSPPAMAMPWFCMMCPLN